MNNASEARKLALEKYDAIFNSEVKDIEVALEAAIENGKTAIYIPSLLPKTTDYLESLGYKIDRSGMAYGLGYKIDFSGTSEDDDDYPFEEVCMNSR